MARKKEQCPDCSTHTITFNPKNVDIIYAKKEEYRKSGNRKTIEQIVNILIGGENGK